MTLLKFKLKVLTVISNMFLKTVIRLKIVFNIISSLILCELGLII